MSPTVLILKDGLPIFHRSYGDETFENLDLTAGLFQAILQLSKEGIGQVLDAISMSDFLFYFKMKDRFTFILREEKDSPRTKEEVDALLEEISDRFFSEFPNAPQWCGNLREFDGFTVICDEFFQESQSCRGFPLLLRIVLKPFFLTPVTQVISNTTQISNYFEELRAILVKYSDQGGGKGLKERLRNPQLYYMPVNERLVYIYPFNQNLKNKDPSHLLCFIIEERDWFTLYQLIPSVHKRGQLILPDLTEYLTKLEKNPSSEEIKQRTKKMQEYVKDWADLNQYFGGMQVSIFEEFIKSGISGDILTEDQVRTNFTYLLEMAGTDADKLLFALLGLRRVLFVAEDQQLVENMVSAILAFYPSPSVTLWTKEPSESLLIGTCPNSTKYYNEKTTVIVDLMNKRILGGIKNEYCAIFLNEVNEVSQTMPVNDSHILFQNKVTSMFVTLKLLLEALSLGENEQQQQFQEILSNLPVSMIQILALMSDNLNQDLAVNIQKFLSATKLKSFVWSTN